MCTLGLVYATHCTKTVDDGRLMAAYPLPPPLFCQTQPLLQTFVTNTTFDDFLQNSNFIKIMTQYTI